MNRAGRAHLPIKLLAVRRLQQNAASQAVQTDRVARNQNFETTNRHQENTQYASIRVILAGKSIPALQTSRNHLQPKYSCTLVTTVAEVRAALLQSQYQCVVVGEAFSSQESAEIEAFTESTTRVIRITPGTMQRVSPILSKSM